MSNEFGYALPSGKGLLSLDLKNWILVFDSLWFLVAVYCGFNNCLVIIAIIINIVYVSMEEGEIVVDRVEAMALLKELVAINLVDSSFINMLQREPNQYQLQIKGEYFKSRIEEYAKQFGLSIEEDKERKYLVIFKSGV